MGVSKITEDDYKEIVSMIKDGYKYRVIGEKFGLDESRIRQIRKKENIIIESRRLSRTFGSDGKAYTESDIDNICEMFTNGITIKDISKMYNVSYNKIHIILKNNGLTKEEKLDPKIEKEIIEYYNMNIRIDLIERILNLKNIKVNSKKISDCLRRNGVKTKKYIPKKDIYIRQTIIRLKYDCNMSNEEISIITDKSDKQVRRMLLEYKKTLGETK